MRQRVISSTPSSWLEQIGQLCRKELKYVALDAGNYMRENDLYKECYEIAKFRNLRNVRFQLFRAYAWKGVRR